MKFSKKDFKLFEKSVRKWCKLLAPEFNVRVVFKAHNGSKENIATCASNKQGGIATIYLNDKFVSNYKVNLDEIAFHETCHLLFARFSRESDPFLSITLIDEIEHEIIAKLENVLFKKEGK